MTELIVINGVQWARMYCVCGYEYKVRDNGTVDDFLYEGQYHPAIHPEEKEWDIASADYYLNQNIGWGKLERSRG